MKNTTLCYLSTEIRHKINKSIEKSNSMIRKVYITSYKHKEKCEIRVCCSSIYKICTKKTDELQIKSDPVFYLSQIIV